MPDRKQAAVSATEVSWPESDRVTPRPWPPDYTPAEWVQEVVGAIYRGWDGNSYECVAYEPRAGFWMAQVGGSRVTNASERAIGRTFHRVQDPDALGAP